MNRERELELLNDLHGRYPDEVIMRCMFLVMNVTLDAVVRAVESLYERGVPRDGLFRRRIRAWDLFLDLVDRMTLIPNLGHHPMAFRACLLVFITRMALEQQNPRILAEWYRIGAVGDPVNNRMLHIGNL